MTCSAHHKGEGVRVRSRLTPLDLCANCICHTALRAGCTSHADLGGVFSYLREKKMGWPSGEKVKCESVVVMFGKTSAPLSAWSYARTDSLFIQIVEWEGCLHFRSLEMVVLSTKWLCVTRLSFLFWHIYQCAFNTPIVMSAFPWWYRTLGRCGSVL